MNKTNLNLVFIAPANSIHTVRWANAIAKRVEKITLITLHKPSGELDSCINVIWLRIPAPFGYFFCAMKVRSVLNKLSPDFVHAHYGSGYGLLARLSKTSPLLLSLWGSDVFNFPHRSRWHYKIFKKNLLSADHVAVTSTALRIAVEDFLPDADIFITPFGIDTVTFSPQSTAKTEVKTIGTVKALEGKYGIDTLIRAFAKAREIGLSCDVKLRIVGSGPQQKQLNLLVEKLNLSHSVDFIPHVNHAQVPYELRKLDIYLALSNEESFGVAPLEASSCSLPVICSRVGGLPEVIEEGKTGYLVPAGDCEAAAMKIVELASKSDLRVTMGENGRKLVLKNYSWDMSVERMLQIYDRM